MSLSKSIAKNTIIHTLGRFSASAIGVFVVALMTRYLGTTGYGHFATIMAYLFFFTIIGDLGLYLVTVNELGHAEDKKKYFSNIFTLRLVSTTVLMIIACALIWVFPYPLIVKLGVLIFAGSSFFMMLDQILIALFQSQMKTHFPALAEVVGKLLILGLVILAIQLKLGFLFVVLTFSLGLLIHFIINLSFARRLLKFKLDFDKKIWQSIFKKSWPVATYMIFSMLYFKADTIILSLYHPASSVGIYGAPYKILEVLIVFPAIFMGLVSPHLSKSWAEKNLENFKRIWQKAFDALSIIIWPMIFGTLVLAGPIINLIAGSQFAASIPVLQILIVATGVIFLAHLSTFSVVAVNKQKSMMKYYILAAALAMAFYFIFIPKYSYYAAALITILIELFILIASWLMVRRTTKIKTSFSNNLKSLFISLIMAGILYLALNLYGLGLTNFGLLVSLILGAIIYLGGLYLFGLFKKEMITEFIKK